MPTLLEGSARGVDEDVRRPAPLRRGRRLDALLRGPQQQVVSVLRPDSHQPVDVILEEIETDPTGIFWG